MTNATTKRIIIKSHSYRKLGGKKNANASKKRNACAKIKDFYFVGAIRANRIKNGESALNESIDKSFIALDITPIAIKDIPQKPNILYATILAIEYKIIGTTVDSYPKHIPPRTLVEAPPLEFFKRSFTGKYLLSVKYLVTTPTIKLTNNPMNTQ